VRLQQAGHINVESGHGEWPLGWALLHSLLGDAEPAPVAGARAKAPRLALA